MMKPDARRVVFGLMYIQQHPDTRNDRNHNPVLVDRFILTTWRPIQEDLLTWIDTRAVGVREQAQAAVEARRMGAVPRWG